MTGKYRTIVADPPWAYPGGWPGGSSTSASSVFNKGPRPKQTRTALPYPSMSIEEICALPVASLAASDAHLYLWTTNRYLRNAYAVAEAWDFRFSQILVWAKTPMGIGPGGAFAQSAEFILFCRRGSLKPLARHNTVWFNWKRAGLYAHSKKPDAMLDLVEQVSPGPYVELFARRARFGWDYYGDESLGTATLGEAA